MVAPHLCHGSSGMVAPMNAISRKPQDDRDPKAVAERTKPPAEPPFDWQVLLLRYLPEPRGSTHAIKRLAPR
jgi:hypothetical protein